MTTRTGIAILTAVLVAAIPAVAGTTPQSFDDFAPAGGGSTPTDDGATLQIVDRDIGAGVRVAVVSWVRGGVTYLVRQIWYVDLDGDGQFSRGDRILFIREY